MAFPLDTLLDLFRSVYSSGGTAQLRTDVASSALPTGAATSANQTTANTSLSSIDIKTPSLGQATMANSSPVAIASNQSAIPVSQFGNWYIYDSTLGVPGEITPFGNFSIAQVKRLVGPGFTGNIVDPNFWTLTTANGGTGIVTGGYCRLRTFTTANGSSGIESIRVGRYLAGNTSKYRGVVQLTTAATANNIRRWGAFDANNGFFFELNGSTFSIVTRKGTIDTVVSSGSFNGAVSTYTPDTNVHTYEIFWSNSRVWFIIDSVLIHTVSATTTTVSDTLSLKVSATNTNINNSTANVILDIRINSLSRETDSIPGNIYKNLSTNSTNVLKYGPGTLSKIVFNNDGLAGNTITIYDNTSATGTTIATIDSSNVVAGTLTYDVDFNVGLTIVIAGGHAFKYNGDI